MTIIRANPPGFGVGDKLTSAQINAIDINTTSALDKRAAQTDTLASIVSCGGAGRIVDSYAAGADAPTTYLISGANSIINAAGITALRTYTLGTAGAVAGDRVMILNPSSFQLIVQNAALAIIAQLGPTTAASGGGANGATSTWADFLFNGTAWVLWRSAQPSAPTATTFTANGTWICPTGVTFALVALFGGGGAGGGGGGGGTTAGASSSGGGGGGGARPTFQLAGVSSGTTYTVTVGVGGTAGLGGGLHASGFAGGDGGDSTFSNGGTVVTGRGAAGGVGGPSESASTLFANGGTSVRGADVGAVIGSREPNCGGLGGNFTGSRSGNPSIEGGVGGAAGAVGASAGSAAGSGGGGGGGAGGGPINTAGTGGAGGGGGSSSGAASGLAGTAGAVGQAFTGSGGGGGGAGGSCTAGGAFVAVGGSNGGAGAVGFVIVIPLR